ncbi:MAG TPA: dockerin type I domain-containing protein, partial [Pirellulaceae bacterium]|nr:dockerin type I domain-containing protein [Pirellulaceae bacterium]
GYYATQITNSASGAPAGFSQEDSLMSSGYRLTSSYNNHSLPVSTQSHLGWRDADSNGIIDLLDEPFTLTGSGFRDSQGNYRFVGQSTVQASPNLNPYGLKNDITINRIRVAEYKLDTGPWTVAATYDTYSATLNLSIPLPAGEHSIQIRTRDTTTNIASTIFSASTNLPASAAPPGLSGFAFNDVNNNGVWEASEGTIGGRDVQLVNASGIPLAGPTVVEADAYAVNGNVSLGVTQFELSARGSNVATAYVYAVDATSGDATSNVLGNRRKLGSSSVYTEEWTNGRQLRVDFNTPVSMLSIDAIGVGDSGSYGRLEIFNANDELLDRYTTRNLTAGQIEKMLLSRGTADIAYALAFGHAGKSVALDNLRVGPEVTTTTDARGAYSLPSLASGTYYVKANVPLNWIASNPSLSVRQTSLVAGQLTADVNFGQHSLVPSWQNVSNRFDVDSNSAITPLDALLIINNLNTFGARRLTTPPPSGSTLPNFIDVNGDGSLTPIDALEIINYINAGGMGESPANVAGEPPSDPGDRNAPQGEAALTQAIWWQLPPTSSQSGESAKTFAADSESEETADKLAELHALYGPEFWPAADESTGRRRGGWAPHFLGDAGWLDALATDVATRSRS